MNKLDELTQIFYEISMSIGMSLNLSKMLRHIALETLRKLNCTALVVFMQRQDDDKFYFERVFITPRAFQKNDAYASLEKILSRSFNLQESERFYTELPIEMRFEDGSGLHVMELPGFGLIALFRAQGCLKQNVIYSFNSINRKLAVACKACQSHGELEALLKNRTIELEEKKKTEHALRESEARFRDLVENTSDWIWETNAEGVYTYVSPAVENILGHTPESLLGKTPFDLMDQEEARRVGSLFSEAVANRSAIVALENTNRHEDGRTVILETSGVPIIDAKGAFRGFRGVDRDITVRKETQQRLKKSEERYRTVFSTAPMAFIVWDRDCRILEWNDQAKKLFGYRLAEVEGKNFFDLIIPEAEKEAIEHVVENLLQNKIEKNVVNKNRTKNGDLIWCEWNNAILRDENGEISGAMSIGLDITERIRTEHQLVASERTYREIFNGSNDVVFIHDIESGIIIDVNLKVTELYGYEPSELIGKTVEPLSLGEPPFTMVEASEWIKKSIDEGPQTFEWMALDKNGEALWVDVSLKKVSIAGSDRLMAVVRDIRQRKAAEQEVKAYREHLEELVAKRTAEIEAKNKELETFTYSVSHDLKAPLRGIDGYSRLLAETYSDQLDDEGLFFLNNVRQGAAQMNKLIEDLLAYSRTERKEIHHTSIDLKSLIENLVNLRRHEIDQGRVELTVDLPFETIESDSETLRQVLANYLDNAIKYKKKDVAGTVTIGGGQDDEFWTLWVKDSGIGFDPKYTDRIFDIFQRLHRVEEYPGTGVGLAIVRKAVERIGGRVRANSSPGKGATFFMDIPKNKQPVS